MRNYLLGYKVEYQHGSWLYFLGAILNLIALLYIVYGV
jgi:hypothetical protein